MNEWGGVLSTIAITMAVGTLFYSVWRDRRTPDTYQQILEVVKKLSADVSRQAIRILDLERLVGDYEAIIYRLMAQITRMGGTPEATLPLWTNSSRTPQLLDVYEVLNERFSTEELYSLAFRFGIGRDAMAGETHTARAQFLIEYAEKRRLVDDLVRVGRELRKDIEWPIVKV